MAREAVFLGQLEAFLEIARLGSYTRAAETLFLTQPALTARVKRLEAELGVKLLVRSGRGAQLTQAGRSYIPYAEEVIAAFEAGHARLQEYSDRTGGEILLAATPTMGTYVLPSVIGQIVSSEPTARVVVTTAVSEEVLQLVLRGEVEIGFSRTLHHPDIEAAPLYDEDFVLVADPRHPLARKRRVDARALKQEHLVIYDRSASFHEFIRELRDHGGVGPRSVVDVDNSEASKRIVMEGLGITLLPRTAVAYELANGFLSELRLMDIRPMRRSISVIRLKDQPSSLLATSTIQLVRRRLDLLGLRVSRKSSRAASPAAAKLRKH